METNDIKALMELFANLSINEMKIEQGENSLYLAKSDVREVYVDPGQAIMATANSAPKPIEDSALEMSADDPNLEYVTSPIVGTFYAAPNPNSEPFVKIGDSIEKGQVLCIVEAMKLMNEILAETGGTIHQVFIENAQPVEYGQKLFSIKK